MWLQLVLVFLALYVCVAKEQTGNTAKNRHDYVTFLIVLLVLQSALRNLAVGEDTYSYYSDWEYTRDYRSWSWIWHNFYDVYVLGEGKDAGYHFLMKTIQIICPYFRVFLFIVATAFFVPLFRYIETELKTLKKIYISFCIYQVLFYSFFSTTGIRQTIATVATIYGIKFIKERKLIYFVIIIIIACFVHKSVLLFLPFFYIARIKAGKLTLLASIVVLPIIFPYARYIAVILATFSGSDVYMRYAESQMETSGAANFLFFILSSGLLTLAAKYKTKQIIPDYICNAVALAILFTPMMWVDTSLMRVIQYFSIFVLVAVPLALDAWKFNKRGINIIYFIFWFVLLITIIRHNYDYGFLWDTMQLGENYR